jgi:hypothetical protein
MGFFENVEVERRDDPEGDGTRYPWHEADRQRGFQGPGGSSSCHAVRDAVRFR